MTQKKNFKKDYINHHKNIIFFKNGQIMIVNITLPDTSYDITIDKLQQILDSKR